MSLYPLIGLKLSSLELGDVILYFVMFVVLMLLIKHFAWEPVNNMLEKRRSQISNDLDNAAASKKKAQSLAQEREDALKNSRSEALEIVSNAKAHGKATQQQMLDEANNEAKVIKTNALEEAKKSKTDALNSAQADIADIAVAISSKLIQKNLTADDQKDLINNYIKGLDD
ncbi:F0F1 ATP synthase subunit B [Holzapfeliella sp. He02]|uniref:ATP synthase subunit b n=1 Tax=Holzapfeliella saturejae TaxID=3082953 RepID=A0ABU8SFY4_9LACO